MFYLGPCENDSEVFSGRFYMGIFAANTPKRHVLYSNDEELLNQILAKAGYMSREAQQQCPGATTIKYVDKRGVKRCTGIKQALRDSQRLVVDMAIFILGFGLGASQGCNGDNHMGAISKGALQRRYMVDDPAMVGKPCQTTSSHIH